jgi:hypothetical protein
LCPRLRLGDPFVTMSSSLQNRSVKGRRRINSVDDSWQKTPAEGTQTRRKKVIQCWKCHSVCKYFPFCCPWYPRNCRQVGISLLLYSIAAPFLYFGGMGPGTMRGGPIGDYIDKRLLRHNIRTAFQERKERQLQAGMVLPMLDIRNNRFRKEMPSPFSELAERLDRTFRNKQKVWDAEQFAGRWKEQCTKNVSSTSIRSSGSDSLNIPNWILQPNEGDWYRPLRVAGTSATLLSFDESDMERLIRQQFSELLPLYESATTKASKILIWTICALYWYGGYAFGNSVRDTTALTDSTSALKGLACGDYGVLLLEGQVDEVQKMDKAYKNTVGKWYMFAASPRHPQLYCLLRKMGQGLSPPTDVFDAADVLDEYQPGKVVQSGDNKKQTWDWQKISSSCIVRNDECCKEVPKRGDLNVLIPSTDSQIFIKGIEPDGYSRRLQSWDSVPLGPRVEVSVSDVPNAEPSEKVTKLAILDRLENASCLPSWLCNRCLRTMLFGSFESCSFICNSCYDNMQCKESTQSTGLANTKIEVREKRVRVAGETLIPRIVHQTFPDAVSPITYPELSRLQNSWRYSGFDFRFYNDNAAREYVATNFPPRFLNAYDSFLPGAFKVGSVFRPAEVRAKVPRVC